MDLSRLGNLKELLLSGNWLDHPHVSVLGHLTALNVIDLSNQGGKKRKLAKDLSIGISSSLLPMLHRGLTLRS
jgi:hypothetical protein